MNYPTREEFEDLKEEVRKLKEQRTGEMKVVKVEVASEDVLKRLGTLEHGQQEISRKQDEHFKQIKEEFASIEKRQAEQDKGLVIHSRQVSALHEEMKGARADIANIQ